MTDKENKVEKNKQPNSDKNEEQKKVVAQDKNGVKSSIKASDKNINNKAESEAKKIAKHQYSRSNGNKSKAYEIFLFIAVLGFITAAVYYLEQQLKEQTIHTRAAIDEQVNKWTPHISELERSNSELQKKIGILDESQNNLTESFSALIKSRRHIRNDWLLAEAEYLLSMANHRLLLSRDINSALVAMQTADERLRDMADPAIIPLRKQFAIDITKLKAIPQPDISGISLALHSLVESVDKLVLLAPGADKVTERDDATLLKVNYINDWSELPKAVWDDIKKMIVVREHHGKVMPLLSPDQYFFLKQNLTLKLEQAQLALLENNTQIYMQRLQAASDWISEYFKAEDPATQSVLKQIVEMQGKNIQPLLPDISHSYQVLKDFREQQSESGNREGKR